MSIPILSKTERMRLMSRMTGHIPPPIDRKPTLFFVTPGFVPERDRCRRPAPFNALAKAAGLIRDEAAELRERFPNADIPEEVQGGYLIPPEYGEYGDVLMKDSSIVIDIQDAPAVWFPILNNGVCDRIELSPREESLLREAPVFRTSQLEEPQPDVIVKPKETQC